MSLHFFFLIKPETLTDNDNMVFTVSLSPFVASFLVGVLCSLAVLLILSLMRLGHTQDPRPILVLVRYFLSVRWIVNLVLVLLLAWFSSTGWPASAVGVTSLVSALIAAVIGATTYVDSFLL